MKDKYFAGNQIKPDSTVLKINLLFRANDGSDLRILRKFIPGNNADVTAHHFHTAQLAAQSTVLTQTKALWSDGGTDI